ncbi:MAG: acyltransferase family protein, partial [Proteobacteria bacterium]|nr:acyltransferase family protein [Pseudomonadota bacterium]
MKNQSSTFTGAGHVTQTDRLYYLDWLRVFAILAILFHHCSKIFDYHTTDLFNSIRSFAPSIHREFEALWIMPLFFVISGASVHYSLKSRKAGGFIKERILRIAIPLVFIGTFIIAPPQIYVMRFFHGHFSGNFIEWYHSHYFNGVWPIGNFNPFGLGTHLWYLFFLFLFSLILLPLFIPFKNTGKSAISRISYLFVNPWALFLLFLPVSAASALFEAMGLGVVRIAGHWDQISFLLFFGYGYLIFCNSRIQETIRKYSTTFLVVALIFTALYLDSHFGVFLKISGVTEHNLLENSIALPQNHSVWIAVQAFRGLLAWCWIIGLLGLARRFLNFNNRFLVYANEAVLPFYILHHTIIYIIGFFIVQWSSGVGIKYFSIVIVSFTVIMVIYEILVRRVNILRILFGMKSKKDFKNQQTALCVTVGLFFVLVMALVVVSLNRVNISPPPTKPGSYVNKEFGFQLTFPTSMNKPGKLTPYDVLFHIKHPEKTLYLKVRKNAIPSNQPLDPYVGKKWIKMLMVSLGMKYPEVLSTEIFTTP